MISEQQLIGAWRLEAWTVGYRERDRVTTPFGDEPDGLLIYSSDGWMSASIAARDRPAIPPGTSPRRLSAELRAEAFSSCFHYAGYYRVVDGDVLHYVTHSLNPDMCGTRQLRHAELDGDTLVLSGKEEVAGETRFHSLVWHRLPAGEPARG